MILSKQKSILKNKKDDFDFDDESSFDDENQKAVKR